MQPADPQSLDPAPPSREVRAKKSIYKVPRRFDLATVFVVTFAYALCFGALRALDAPIGVQIAIVGLLTSVGIIQMIVPERHVRFAAILCGCSAIIALDIYLKSIGALRFGSSILCVVITLGPLLGYCSGVVVAGVFLISDYVRRGITCWLGTS